MVIEEYRAELVYVPEENNIVADTISRNDTAAKTLEGKEKAFFIGSNLFESPCL